jgi:hypothetical protein
LPFEGSDPKVLEFLQILEEYRVKCEDEGNYLEAARAHRQLGILRKQEEKRQQKAIQARQISEKQDVQLAHNLQFNEFNKSWDKYLRDYDHMAQTYIEQMTERHSIVLLEFQKELRQGILLCFPHLTPHSAHRQVLLDIELASKPPKWSRELLDQRRKQHVNARNKNYTVAQKLKKLSDKTEEEERRHMEQEQAVVFARREAKFRIQQQTELQALLKRIECRRKEHIKQRNLDTKRLLQRNRNVQAVLENKHASESQKLFSEIKKTLYSTAALHGGYISKAISENRSKANSTNASSINKSGKKPSSKQGNHSKRSSSSNDLGNYDQSMDGAYDEMPTEQEYGQHGSHDAVDQDPTREPRVSFMASDPSFMKASGPKFSNMIYADTYHDDVSDS